MGQGVNGNPTAAASGRSSVPKECFSRIFDRRVMPCVPTPSRVSRHYDHRAKSPSNMTPAHAAPIPEAIWGPGWTSSRWKLLDDLITLCASIGMISAVMNPMLGEDLLR